MTDEDRLEAIIAAVTGSIVGTGDDMVVDLERFENGLVGAEIPVTATTHRGNLIAELSVIREERRVQAARRDNASGYDRQELADIVERIDAREAEIQALLWK